MVTSLDFTLIGAFRVLFAILGTIFNCGAIVTVLSSRNLRSKGMYITIVVISFAGLLQSIFANQVAAHASLRNTAGVDDDLCSALFGAEITASVCTAVTMYCLVLLFVNHLLHRRSPNETRERNTGIAGTILICVLSVVVFVPVHITQTESECFLERRFNLVVGLYVIEFFLPCFILCVATPILEIILERRIMAQVVHQRSSVTHIIVAACITVATTMPVLVLVLHFKRVGYPSTSSTNWNIWLHLVFQMIYAGNVVVIPFPWLLDKEFRQSFLTMFKRKPKPNRNTAPLTTNSNNANQPDQILDTQPSDTRNTAPLISYSNDSHEPFNIAL